MSRIPVALPPLFERAREAFTRSKSCPDPYSFGAILAAFSMAAAPYRFQIGNHVNPPAMWVVLVGDSGRGKTPAINEACRPVEDYEFDLSIEAQREWRGFKEREKRYDVIFREHAKTEAFKAGVPCPETEPEPPVFQHRFVTDATLEGLLRMHKGGLGVGVASDELSSWLNSFTRYSSNSARGTWLSLFSGTKINQQRADMDSARTVRNPSVSVLGGIQRSTLEQLKSGLDDGLSYRMLFFSATPKLILRSESNIRNIEDETAIRDYRQAVLDWMNAHKADMEPTVIRANPEAELTLVRAINAKLKQYADPDAEDYSPFLNSMWSKMEIYLYRLAGLHCLMRHVSSGADTRKAEVKPQDVEWAAQLIELSLLPASIEMLRSIEQSGGKPITDGMLPVAIAEFIDTLPNDPFQPLSKDTIALAKATIREWSELPKEMVKSRLRTLFKSRSTSHLFHRLPDGWLQKC